MYRLLTIAMGCLIVASTLHAQTSQSAYRPKQWDPLGRALAQFKDTDAWVKEKKDLYERWEKDGKLYAIEDDSRPRVYRFMADNCKAIRGLVTLYQGALDEGLIPDDDQMKLAREVYAKVSEAMAPYGYWYPHGITDTSLPQPEMMTLVNARDQAFLAMAFAKAGNTAIAAEYYGHCDKDLSDLAEKSRKDEDLGKKYTTWKITEQPDYKAAMKEIERIKALSEPEMAKAKNAKDQAKSDQQAEAARLKGLQEQAKKDWAELEKVYNDAYGAIKDIRGDVSAHDAAAYLPKLVDFESKVARPMQAALDTFTAKYGKREDAIKKIYQFKGDAISDAELAHMDTALAEMADAVALPAKQRKDVAESLLREANTQIDLADKKDQQKAFSEAAKTLKLALDFDATNAEAKKKLDSLAGEAAAADAAAKKEFEDRTWPGEISNFDGPGTKEELADSIRAFLTKHPEVMKYVHLSGQPVAVAIRGQWHSVDKDLLNQTTQWGLNALVAYVPDASKDEALCTDITIKTANEGGVKKAPPWNEVSAMEPYRMRASKIPANAASAGTVTTSAPGVTGVTGSAGSTRDSTGAFGWVLWLLLALANIAAGALAAEGFLAAKLPPAVQTYLLKGKSMRSGIGATALVVGLLCLVWSLIALRPLSGLLPELSAIAVGLVLARPILANRVQIAANAAASAPTEAPGFALKAQRALEAQATRLETLQIPLGLAAIALGVLHLLLGWLLPLV